MPKKINKKRNFGCINLFVYIYVKKYIELLDSVICTNLF